MEVVGPIDQEPAWVENVVAEVRSNISNELPKGYSAKLQRFMNKLECLLGQNLALTARQSDQLSFEGRARRSCAYNPSLIMMVKVCSSHLHFSQALVYPVTRPSLRRSNDYASEGGSRNARNLKPEFRAS